MGRNKSNLPIVIGATLSEYDIEWTGCVGRAVCSITGTDLTGNSAIAVIQGHRPPPLHAAAWEASGASVTFASPQIFRAVITGSRLLPRGVRLYSTFGGTSG